MSNRPFSWKWVFVSIGVFMATEAALAWLVGELLVGRYISQPGGFRYEGILYLLSYFVGGFIVGIVSPGKRLWEPAIGAFTAAAAGWIVSIFVPLSWFRMDTWKVLVGGVIALSLALWGAELGEKLTGNLDPEDEVFS